MIIVKDYPETYKLYLAKKYKRSIYCGKLCTDCIYEHDCKYGNNPERCRIGMEVIDAISEIKDQDIEKYRIKRINWESDKQKKLIAMYNNGAEIEDIARELETNTENINSNLCYLRKQGLVGIRKPKIVWSKYNDTIFEMMRQGKTFKRIANFIGVGKSTLATHVYRLREKRGY